MTERFIACDACRRHVKESDAACPFCGAVAPRLPPLPRLLGVRMKRAAMVAAGTAGTMAALLDCGPSAQPVPFYGVPIAEDAGPVVGRDAEGAADVSLFPMDAQAADAGED